MPPPPLRDIFTPCTGRFGSTPFAAACGQMTRRTAGHETRTHLPGLDRLTYPPFHIEADNRLPWMLGRLDDTFGANGLTST